jgi:hypothetical protein
MTRTHACAKFRTDLLLEIVEYENPGIKYENTGNEYEIPGSKYENPSNKYEDTGTNHRALPLRSINYGRNHDVLELKSHQRTALSHEDNKYASSRRHDTALVVSAVVFYLISGIMLIGTFIEGMLAIIRHISG